MAIKIQGDTVIFDDKVFKVGSGTTAQRPASPQTGMIRFNTDLDSIEGYDGTDWGPLGGSGAEVSDTAPSSPNEGDLWWDSTSGSLKIYYDDGTSQQWVDASPTLSGDFVEDVYEPPPETLGQAYGGGFYIGTICAANTCYYLIVAPNATGCALCQWKTTRTTTAGTTSLVDGYANTYGPMDNAEHPAGNWTATRTIGGFSDWYLPAKDELNVLYVNDGGAANTTLPAGEGFAAVVYWSSTENSAPYACIQLFTNGNQSLNRKTNSSRVRAVRREPI